MNLFVALAPVIYVENMNSDHIKKWSKDKNVIKILYSTGPEIGHKANSSDFISSYFVESGFGSAVTTKAISELSDKNPATISDEGITNYFKFYPSGSSY